jgi:hypothetical protein
MQVRRIQGRKQFGSLKRWIRVPEVARDELGFSQLSYVRARSNEKLHRTVLVYSYVEF